MMIRQKEKYNKVIMINKESINVCSLPLRSQLTVVDLVFRKALADA